MVAAVLTCCIVAAVPQPRGQQRWRNSTGPYYITQFDANLNVESSFKSTNTDNFHRNSDGSITCTPNTNLGGLECVNAPVTDRDGVV
jgi:hypothetical protein